MNHGIKTQTEEGYKDSGTYSSTYSSQIQKASRVNASSLTRGVRKYSESLSQEKD